MDIYISLYEMSYSMTQLFLFSKRDSFFFEISPQTLIRSEARTELPKFWTAYLLVFRLK